MRNPWGVGVVMAALALAPAAHATSFDSLAPKTAPPHWLPPAPWVYNHWLPFGEQRLYRLGHFDRGDLWRQLRDDHRTVWQLAARHGWKKPAALAAALVPSGNRELRNRALMLLTQGHLAQHVFFHSLHQFAIASEAPKLFGISDIAFRALRRSELSPLAIGRLHGRSVGAIEAGAIAVLRERARFGVRTGQTPAAQAALLLHRQVSQLPRWLGQARYNGPPPTHLGELAITPRDHAANPAISADGTRVVYEAYRQNLKAAITFGEIAVLQRDLGGASSDLAAAPQAPSLTTSGAALVSRPVAPEHGTPRPASAYNPAVSGDGLRIAFERAPGNNNFAKRYGRIGVFVAGPSGDAHKVDHAPKGAHFSQSAYNPQLSADGRRVVFQAVRDGGRVGIYESATSGGLPIVVAGGMRDSGDRFADVYEPSVSADGGRIAYTRVAGRVSGGRITSRVYVRDLQSGRQIAASPARALASNPMLSGDGRFVAYVAGGMLHVHDLRTGRDERVPTRGAAPLDPQLSRGAKVVAFTAVGRDGSSQVLAYDRVARKLGVVAAAGSDPSISADGTKVAFASRADDLDPAKRDDTEAVFVRDMASGKTVLVSAPSDTPAAPPRPPAPLRARSVPGAARTISIFDNQFASGAPVVHVRTGSVVGWDWRGNESHNVTVRRGAELFHTRTKSGGLFAHRFTRPGRYQIVCSLHSPGMGMTLVVS